MGLSKSFANSFLKTSMKALWVSLYFVVFTFLFLHQLVCTLNVSIVILKQLFQISFKLRPIITLEYRWLFKQTILSVLCLQCKCNLTCFIRLKRSTILQPCRLLQHHQLLTCTCMCSLQRHEVHKVDQTDAAHQVLSPCNGWQNIIS